MKRRTKGMKRNTETSPRAQRERERIQAATEGAKPAPKRARRR